jgi:hypothetical protein
LGFLRDAGLLVSQRELHIAPPPTRLLPVISPQKQGIWAIRFRLINTIGLESSRTPLTRGTSPTT